MQCLPARADRAKIFTCPTALNIRRGLILSVSHNRRVWTQAYSGLGATAALEHLTARRCTSTPLDAATAGERSVSTDHRLSAAGGSGGHLLGVTAKLLPRDSLTASPDGSGVQQQPMYELVWQVSGTAAPPASRDAGRRQSKFSLTDHRATAAASMLALLQAADAHRASAVDLLSTERARALSKSAISSAAHSGSFSGLLRTFAQESSAAVGSSRTDPSTAGDLAGSHGVRLVLGSEKPDHASDVYGSRTEAATQLSAVLLPSTMQNTMGAQYAPFCL